MPRGTLDFPRLVKNMFEIYTQDLPGTICQNLFIVGKNYPFEGKFSFLQTDIAGNVIITTINREEAYTGSTANLVKPLIANLPSEMIHKIVMAFAEYAKKQGIEAESESKAKGKLEAMTNHLQDLRTLLKLK